MLFLSQSLLKIILKRTGLILVVIKIIKIETSTKTTEIDTKNLILNLME